MTKIFLAIRIDGAREVQAAKLLVTRGVGVSNQSNPMWFPWMGALAIGLALTVASCGSSSSSNNSGNDGATYETAPCPADQAATLAKFNATCGVLTVPENRSVATGAKIQLPVAMIPPVSKSPAPDPVVYMAGGPGANALSDAPYIVAAGMNQNRTVIVMDQRGNTDTKPERTCPETGEIDEFNIEAIGLPYDAASTGVLHVAATTACHDRLAAAGIDLSAFNTTENASDFADLRRVLKIPQWNVYGLSYGTDLALSYLRDHPEGIRSFIIDSVLPPSVATPGWLWTNANEGINNIFRACAAQSACAGQYGDLAGAFGKLVQQLEANPLTTTGQYDPTVPPVTVVLDGGALVNWLASVPQALVPISAIPSAISDLAAGDATQIANSRSVATNPGGIGQYGYGLFYGVFCSELVPFSPQSQILAQGLLAFPTFAASVLSQAPQAPFLYEDCAVWNVPPASPSVRQVTISSIPALVMAGSFDGKTSPQSAFYAASTLSNSTTVVIPGGGHGALYLVNMAAGSPAIPCSQGVFASFLANPSSPNVGCVGDLTPPPFDIVLPRNSIVPLTTVNQFFPEPVRELTTGANSTSVANPKATRSVIYIDSVGMKKVTVTLDQYDSTSSAAAAYRQAYKASLAVPGFLPIAIPTIGQQSFAGSVTMGAETHVGLGALDGDLIVGATITFYSPTAGNVANLVALAQAEDTLAKQMVGAGVKIAGP